jgi:hypothetical protein
MAKFDFTAYAVTPETTAEYIFSYIVGDPSLVLRPAHDGNEAFKRERLRLALESSEKAQETPKRGGKTTVEDLIRQDADEREFAMRLIARTCAVKWGTAPIDDATTKAAEFSEENVYDFLAALPEWMWVPFHHFVTNLYNFVQRPPISKKAAEQTGNG